MTYAGDCFWDDDGYPDEIDEFCDDEDCDDEMGPCHHCGTDWEAFGAGPGCEHCIDEDGYEDAAELDLYGEE